MNVGLLQSRQLSNRGVFFLQPFPHGHRILFVGSAHRLLRGQTPGSQIASHRPHRNFHSEPSRQQLLHRFPGPQGKGQAQLIRTTTENVAHRRGRLMRSQSRNGRPSSTPCFQRSTSGSFHKTHPAVHRTSSHPKNLSGLSLRKAFLNCLDYSSTKVFLRFCRQRASILSSHARHTNTSRSVCHLYYAPISMSGAFSLGKIPPPQERRETAHAAGSARPHSDQCLCDRRPSSRRQYSGPVASRSRRILLARSRLCGLRSPASVYPSLRFLHYARQERDAVLPSRLAPRATSRRVAR